MSDVTTHIFTPDQWFYGSAKLTLSFIINTKVTKIMEI